MIRRTSALAIVLSLAATSVTSTAFAFVTAPVGGRPGEGDVNARVVLERGKVEPNENQASFQKARWEVYTLGGGYNFGELGGLQDFSVRLEGSYVHLPAEQNDLSRGIVPAASCKGEVSGDGLCTFHPATHGWLFTPSLSANLVHQGNFSLGVFLQGTIPIGLELERFVLPRVDLVAGGIQVGTRLTPWLGYVSRIYVGSGARVGHATQNSAVALTQLFVFEAERWLLPWKAGLMVGPYFEGDLAERYEDRYDAAYTAGYPDRRDRIRSMKFGVAILPYFRVTERFAVELGYVQKLFGYDAPATQFYTVGLRAVL